MSEKEIPSPQTHLMGSEAPREAIKEAATEMLKKTGWKPGDKFSFHSVSELMTALAFTQARRLIEDNERLSKMLAGCDWYWPEEDTSSDACANGPWEIAEIYDLKQGAVMPYSRGGIVETRYYAFLEPAQDADSDDNFEVDEPTEEAVEVKIAAELQRRATSASEVLDAEA